VRVQAGGDGEESRAVQILRIERFLHIDVELTLNRWALHVDGLMDILEKYYKTFHFAVPLAVLAWLYARHPVHYRSARTVLFGTTALALVGFWGFPLAPPRLTPGHGFRDSLHAGADAQPFGAFTHLANQFAAMPSLHIGWSSWCALVIVAVAPYRWVRVLGLLYPVLTLAVVVSTANHWMLDAAGGLLALLLGALLQYALTGRRIGRAGGAAYIDSPLTVTISGR